MRDLLENISFYPHSIIESGGKQFLFSTTTSGIFELDHLSHSLLKGEIPVKEDPRAVEEALLYMKENFIIKTPENEAQLSALYESVLSGKNKMTPRSLMLMVSQECNLRCTYCYGVNGEYSHKGFMTYETAVKAIDCFLENSVGEKLNICFFGGEPLMRFSLIKELVAYADEEGRKRQKHIGYSMTTNATLITPEIEQFMLDHKIYTTISIDGDAKAQNTNRFYANRKGCYEDVVLKTEKLRKTDLLSARATISRDNTNVYDQIKHLVDLGFRRVSWALALNMLEEADVWQVVESQKKLIREVGSLISNQEYAQARKYNSIIDMLSKLQSDGVRTKGCGAGNNIMTVNIDGNIYPCHRFVGNDTAKLGHIEGFETHENQSFYEAIGLAQFKDCVDCFAKNTCAGGCINENFEHTGAINEVPQKRCIYFKELSKAALELFVTLSEEQKEKLFGKTKHDNNLAKTQ